MSTPSKCSQALDACNTLPQHQSPLGPHPMRASNPTSKPEPPNPVHLHAVEAQGLQRRVVAFLRLLTKSICYDSYGTHDATQQTSVDKKLLYTITPETPTRGALKLRATNFAAPMSHAPSVAHVLTVSGVRGLEGKPSWHVPRIRNHQINKHSGQSSNPDLNASARSSWRISLPQ